MNEIPRELKLYETVAAVGFVSSVACAVLYFMRLPIFDETALSWLFVAGLVALCAGALALIIRNIWSQ